MRKEIERQLMHFLVGIVSIALLFYLGRHVMMAAVFFVVIIGLLLINARIRGMKIGFVEWFVGRFEREDIVFSGFGSACYATGVLIPLAFLNDPNEIAATIFILAFGDGVSTIIGRLRKMKIPYNKKKTMEGTISFFIASLPAYYFIGPMIVPVAAIAAITESIPFEIDDNLTIPMACTVFFLVV